MQKNVAIGILVVLLLGSAGANFFLYQKGVKPTKNLVDSVSFLSLKDSLNKVITSKEEELKRLQAELVASQDRLTEAESKAANADVNALQAEIRRLRKGIGGATNKKQLDELKKQLAEKDALIAQLKAETDDIRVKLNDTEQKFRDVNELNSQVIKENNTIKDKLGKGQAPQFGPVITAGVTTKRGQPTDTYKASKVERLRITFDVVENPLVEEPVETEVTLRIIGPEGEVLTKNNPTLADKSELYTMKEVLTFDGAQHKVKLFYSQGTFKKGKYSVELIHDGVLKQKNNFELM